MSQRSSNTISRSNTPRHGHVFSPASRAYFAWQEGKLDEGALNQRESGKHFPQTAGGLKDPLALDDVLSATPPLDGMIASAGQLTGAFLDQPGDHWQKHEVCSGELLPVSWNFTANHPARRWEYFITEEDWDFSRPLARYQFGAKPFYTVQNSWQPFWKYPDELMPPSPTEHEVPLPKREGYHVLLAIYVVADTGMAFYQVIDLLFETSDGGERPDTPTGLTASDVTDKQVVLTWDKAVTPIAKYRITRNGISIVDIDATQQTWTDNSVAAGTRYSYFISAINNEGKVSAPSRAIDVHTLTEDGAPTAPVNLHSMGQTPYSVRLMWGVSTGTTPITQYVIFRNDHEVDRVDGDKTSFEDPGLTPDTTYEYFVKALDQNGKLSSSSNALGVRTEGGGGDYPAWELNARYEKDARVSHSGSKWRCIQAHVSYVSDWAPGVGDNVLWIKQP
ncbi:lytic polysaccharide monooxygenase [Pseudomonas fluorescens]|uniref:lytic polysaccharide monooxygenase n=1 Tax=Pseudomonas TaxID=286 RepID=UPI003D0864D6